MESELTIMQKDVTELRLALTSKQGISQDKFRVCFYSGGFFCVCVKIVDRLTLYIKSVQSLFLFFKSGR